MKRLILGAFLAGITVFIWGMVSHMLLPIGEIGVKMIPNEAAVVQKIGENLTEPGVYLFPGYDTKQPSSKDAEAAWSKKYEAGPNGFLVYQPQGTAPLNPFSFLWELIASVMGALLAGFIAFKSGAEKYWCKVGTVTFMGLFAWIAISIPYWNWYRFPWNFTFSQGIDEVVGWFIAGLVIAWIVKPKTPEQA